VKVTIRFAKYSKANRAERERIQNELDRCRQQISLTGKSIEEAEIAKRRRAEDHAKGHAYVGGGLEDVVVFLETRRAMLEALKEHEASLVAKAKRLDRRSPERAKNQATLVKTELQRTRLEKPIQRVMGELCGLLQQYGELTATMVNLAGKIELDLSGGRAWFDGDAARSLLASLSSLDLCGDSERHAEWFMRELTGEDHPVVERPAPLTGLNSPEESARRYEQLPSTIAQTRYARLRRAMMPMSRREARAAQGVEG
jgi:hypothetical protein